MYKKSINLRLTFGFIAIVIISTLIIGTIALNIFKNNIFQVKRNNIQRHAVEISSIIEPFLLGKTSDKEYGDILKVINSFANSKVWIIDSNGRILTATKNQNNSISFIDNADIKKTFGELIREASSGINSSDEIFNPYYDEYMMTVAVPVRNNQGAVIGVVLLHSPVSDLAKSMDNFFLYLVLALVSEILLAGLMGYYFSKSISRPIKIINNSALEMARGNYGIKTNIYQRDEIGELSNSFDLLSLKLEHTIGQLSDEKTKLNNIITSMNEGILAIDSNFNVINFNQSALDILFPESQNKDRNFITLLKKLELFEDLKESMSSRIKKSVVRKHKSKILSFSISPISNNSNHSAGIVILIQDISEKEKLEQMRKDFVSNVSHEFRTPLTVIRGNIESIVDGFVKPEEIHEKHTVILSETKRLEKMVRNLLDLSKLESGTVELELRDLDVNLLVNDTLRSLRQIACSKNIVIRKNLQENIPPVHSDYDRLKQLLIIFLDNSIKFSPENSIVEVKTSTVNNNLCITVRDNGTGMSKDDIQYIGERFYKADKSRNSSSNGTGLGLSIAKNIVKLLNGTMQIESQIDAGTTVTLIFPLTKEQNEVKA